MTASVHLVQRRPPAVASLLFVCLTAAAASDPAHAEPTAYAHAADCVAALKPAASNLGDRLKAGDRDVEAELLRLTEAGLSFIGEAYKSGLQKEEADRMLKTAETAQKGLPAAVLAERQRACRVEGDRLFAEANALERTLIHGAAKKRVQRLLSK